MKTKLAKLFEEELNYFLEMHYEMEDYYNISFAHNYFHGFDAFNVAELEAMDYFTGLDSSLLGVFRVVLPKFNIDFDF